MTKHRTEPEVKLLKDPLVWKKLPTSIRIALNEGLARIERVRAELAATSKIGVMPAVLCVPEVWLKPDGDGSIDGMSGPIRNGARSVVAATLPAQTIVSDDDVVRRVLVHEFAHAFDLITRIVNHLDAGATGPVSLPTGDADDYEDQEHDDSVLADPADWFSDEDVGRFVHWHSDIGERIHVRMLELGLQEFLPVRTPDRRFKTDQISIALPIIERVRKLRALRASR